MINQSFSLSPQCDPDFLRQMYVHIGNQEYAADEVVGMEGHPGFPGDQNILSKYSLSGWITEMNQSFVPPEMSMGTRLVVQT